MSSRVGEHLIEIGLLAPEVVNQGLARQTIYGGALDTALLEMGVIDEPTIWRALSDATGLPMPSPELLDRVVPALATWFPASWGERCRAAPLHLDRGAIQVICAEPVEMAWLDQASRALGMPIELYIVTEVRLWMARQAVYGEPMPARHLRLLGRLLGSEGVRRWARAHAPARRVEPDTRQQFAASLPGPSPEDDAERAPLEAVLEISSRLNLAELAPPKSEAVRAPAPAAALEDPAVEELYGKLTTGAEDERTGAIKDLRGRLEEPVVRATRERLKTDAAKAAPEKAVAAMRALAALRDGSAVPVLVDRLERQSGEVSGAAEQALIELTRQSFGRRRRRWLKWWQERGDVARVEWLFEALSHRTPEMRLAASEELRELTGQYFGYHFDLPKADREQARRRWLEWWREQQKATAAPESGT